MAGSGRRPEVRPPPRYAAAAPVERPPGAFRACEAEPALQLAELLLHPPRQPRRGTEPHPRGQVPRWWRSGGLVVQAGPQRRQLGLGGVSLGLGGLAGGGLGGALVLGFVRVR